MSLEQVPKDVFSSILTPLNLLDIFELIKTSKSLKYICETSSILDVKKQRMYYFINVFLKLPHTLSFDSQDIHILNQTEKDKLLGQYVNDMNPSSLFSKLVFLNMSDTLANEHVLTRVINLLERICTVFERKVTPGGYDFIGIVIDTNISSSYSGYYDTITMGSFNHKTGKFRLARTEINNGKYGRWYELKKTECFLTLSRNLLILWLGMSTIRKLKSLDLEQQKLQISAIVIEELGKNAKHCPIRA